MTKHKCQCKNHVTNDGDLCERHAKKEANTPARAPASVPAANIPVNVPTNIPLHVPQNILLNGKFVPNIHNIALPPVKKPSTVVQNWYNVQGCGKTPDEMYNYLFPK